MTKAERIYKDTCAACHESGTALSYVVCHPGEQIGQKLIKELYRLESADYAKLTRAAFYGLITPQEYDERFCFLANVLSTIDHTKLYRNHPATL